MKEIRYKVIGVIHSPFTSPRGMPIQPAGARGVKGTVHLKEEYAPGLKDLEGFSHIILLYHFHLSRGSPLQLKPYMDDALRGVFATRAPTRPNPIGLSVVRLLKIEGKVLHVEDVDIVDSTPLLDIKPYVPEFDRREEVKRGWLSGRAERVEDARAD